jgi:hypothetical protein
MSLNYFNQLKKKGLTPNQYYILYCCKHNIQANLLDVNIIKSDAALLKAFGILNDDYSLTEKGEETLLSFDLIFKKTKIKFDEDVMGDDYMTNITKYRGYFPNSKKASTTEIKAKISTFFVQNPSITWDVIFKAVELYFSESREEKYIMKASNFIMVQRGGVNVYTLLEYCERISNGEEASEKNNDVNMYKFL